MQSTIMPGLCKWFENSRKSVAMRSISGQKTRKIFHVFITIGLFVIIMKLGWGKGRGKPELPLNVPGYTGDE